MSLEKLSWEEVEDLSGWLCEFISKKSGLKWIVIVHQIINKGIVIGHSCMFDKLLLGVITSREEAIENVLAHSHELSNNIMDNIDDYQVIPIRNIF